MKDNANIRKEMIAEAVHKNDDRNLMVEVHKMNATKKTISVDGLTDDDEICSLFNDKYNKLYNIVPYDNDEFQKIPKEIDHRLQSEDENDSFIINVYDIIKAVNRLKAGKLDGEEGLHADHIINPPHI